MRITVDIPDEASADVVAGTLRVIGPELRDGMREGTVEWPGVHVNATWRAEASEAAGQ